MPWTTLMATISQSGSPMANTKNRAACASTPSVSVHLHPNRASVAPRIAIDAISAIWPTLIAGMIQFSASPACCRNGLVHWK